MGFPTLKKIYDTYKGDEAVSFLAVQTVFEGHRFNTKGKLISTQTKYHLPIPMGHDASAYSQKMPIPKTMLDYRSGGTPWVVIIDRDGRVAYNEFHIAPDDAIALINRLKDRK